MHTLKKKFHEEAKICFYVFKADGLIEKMLDSTITPIFTNEHAKL